MKTFIVSFECRRKHDTSYFNDVFLSVAHPVTTNQSASNKEQAQALVKARLESLNYQVGDCLKCKEVTKRG